MADMEQFAIYRLPRYTRGWHAHQLLMVLQEYFSECVECFGLWPSYGYEELDFYGVVGSLLIIQAFHGVPHRTNNYIILRWYPGKLGRHIDMFNVLLRHVVKRPLRVQIANQSTPKFFELMVKRGWKTRQVLSLRDSTSSQFAADAGTASNQCDGDEEVSAFSQISDVFVDEGEVLTVVNRELAAMESARYEKEKRKAYINFCFNFHPDAVSKRNGTDYETAFACKVFQNVMTIIQAA